MNKNDVQSWLFSKLAQLSAMYRTLENCNKKMGSTCLFSPCVPIILTIFSLLRAKCSKPKQPSKILILKPKTMNLSKSLRTFVCLGYIFSVTRPSITGSWKNCREMDSFIIVSYVRRSESGNSRHSYLKQNIFYYPDFFFPNRYFLCGHRE